MKLNSHTAQMGASLLLLLTLTGCSREKGSVAEDSVTTSATANNQGAIYGPSLEVAFHDASPRRLLNSQEGVSRLVFFSDEFDHSIAVGPQNLAAGAIPFLTAIGAESTEEENGPSPPVEVDNTLYIEQVETDPATGLSEAYTLAFSSSLEIIDVSARCAGDYAVLLRARNGEMQIERWTLITPLGSWEAKRSQSTGVGQSLPNIAPAAPYIVGGGSFVALHSRNGFPAMRRSIVVDSNAVAPDTQSVTFDADGRYVIASRSRSIEQFVISNQAKTVVVSEADRLNSANPIGDVHIVADPSNGRVLIHRSTGANPQGLLWDQNNDGVFDSSHIASSTADFYQVRGSDLLTRGKF